MPITLEKPALGSANCSRIREGHGEYREPIEHACDYVSAGLKVVQIWWPTETGCACEDHPHLRKDTLRDEPCSRPGKHPLPEFCSHGYKSALSTMSAVERA